MERNTKVILIFFIAIAVLVTIMYYSVDRIETIGNNTNLVVNVSEGFFPPLGEGGIKIMEFSDFACPVCKIQEPVIKQILSGYKNKIKIYYRNFPLQMHENSFLAALASSCANEQNKFWEYHKILFENQGKFSRENLKEYAKNLKLDEEKFNACLDTEKYKKQVNEDIAEGEKAGVRGTPTFFINGDKAAGFQAYDSLKSIIEQAS